MREGTGIHRHPPVYPAPPAEPPRGRADTSNRKLPLCDTETAARLLAEPGRRRRRGDAGCRPDPAPRRGSFTPSPGAAQTRTPGPAPAAARGSLPSPQVRRSGQRQARPRRGKGRRGLLQPCPCRAAPPLPFRVPPAGSAAGAIPAPPPAPSRGAASRGGSSLPSAPPQTRPGLPLAALPADARGTPDPRRTPAPLTAAPSGCGRNLSHQRSSFKVQPEAGEGAWEGKASLATGPEAVRVAAPAACPPRGPSACRSNKFCAQNTADTRFGDRAFVRVYARNRFPTPPWTRSGHPGLTLPCPARPPPPRARGRE